MADVVKNSKQKHGCYITTCGCVSAYQDEKYGVGKRVHNASPTTKINGRCTVCGREK